MPSIVLKIVIKFLTPGCSSQNLTSPTLSVTALDIFFLMTSGGSNIKIYPLGFSSDLDIFFSGF